MSVTRRLHRFTSTCICSLRNATMHFWLEETGATMLGAEVPRLGCGVTSNAELHFWRSARGLTACPGKEKTLRERKQNTPKISASGRGLQRLPYEGWWPLAQGCGPRVPGGTWCSESPFQQWLCPLHTCPWPLHTGSCLPGDAVLALDKKQPPTFGLGIAPVLGSKVCTTILQRSRRLVAMAPSHMDSLMILPGLLADSLQSRRLHWHSKCEGMVKRLESSKQCSMAMEQH